MAQFENWMDDLKQKRDELKLKLHLAGKDAEDEWDELMGEWHKFLSTSQLDKSADEVADAAKHLGLKLKDAYDRTRSGKK